MLSLTVLFTWEIGQGLGHVLPLLPIARELKSQGHRIIFALRDVRSAAALLEKEGCTVLQAPFHPDRFFPADGPQPQTMADILTIFGFASKRHLSGLASAWQNLFTLCKPDVVIASYAPLSLLCAKQAGLPTVLMALPFELPTAIHPSPILRTRRPPPNSLVDDRVINTVNAVFGAEFVASVYDIFYAKRMFLMSVPELDPFGLRKNVAYCGSFFVTDFGVAPSWPEGPYPFKVFAYLNSELPSLDRLRQEIHASAHAYCVCLRDASESLLTQWRAPNVWVVADAVRLDQALQDCDAVLSYGGVGFVSASLLAGKPIVFFLRNLESYLTAQQVVKLGAGLLPQPQTAQGVLRCLDQVNKNDSFKRGAEEFSAKYKAHSPQVAGRKIAKEIQVLAKPKL
jgi:UDP:flavonoid glycosyltransferase YjiC (YdhE family)